MRNKLFLLLLLVLLIPAVWALFMPGFFITDDGNWMVIRFSAFFQAFRDGQIPVRFLGRLNFGYGYPVADFLYPGFMYLAFPIHVLGLSFLNSIKGILIISMLSSGIFCYLWLSKLFDRFSSIIGALFYLYAPYHLYDLYKRGSVGEVLALAIAPFILWQIERENLFWTALGISLLIISHNTLSILFIVFLALYMLINVYVSKTKKKLVTSYLTSLILGFGMSSFFSIPAIFDLQYTVFSKTSVSNFRNYFADINLIGFSTILTFILIISLVISKKIELKRHRLTVLLFIIGILSVFLASSLSLSFWNFIPASFIQFPFRLLSLAILCGSFLASFSISVLKGRLKILAAVLILIFIIMGAISILFPQKLSQMPDSFFSTNEATTTVQDEYMPKWVKVKPSEHFKEKVEIIEGRGEIRNLVYNNKKIDFTIDSESNTKVRVNTIYYPGWKALINGKNSEISYKNEVGVMELSLNKGINQVQFSFGETDVRLLADALSFISLVLLFVIASARLKPRSK